VRELDVVVRRFVRKADEEVPALLGLLLQCRAEEFRDISTLWVPKTRIRRFRVVVG